MDQSSCGNKKHIFLVYPAVFVLFTALYLGSFHTPLFASLDVLFYRGGYLLIASFLILLAAILFIYYAVTKSHLESLIAALLTSAAIHLAFFVIFPVTFERSVTMYLLNTLDNVPIAESCSGLSKLELRQQLINEYVINRDAVGKRLYEQRVINTLGNDDQCVMLTERGSSFLEFSRVVSKIYGVR